MDIPHIPVLYDEVKEVYGQIEEGVIVDCTLGYGGHSELILQSNPNIKLIGIDQDDEALNFSKKRLAPFADRVTFYKGRFSDMINQIPEIDQIRGILADIGVSSLQLDKLERGFGFDSPTLDMRMNPSNPLSAYEVVNSYPQDVLERIFREYGEVREWRKAANLIVQQRAEKPFESAKELADFLAKHLKSPKIHPATLPFQGIRIEVNDELGELKRLLESIRKLNIHKCLVGIISFHSLEDRIVKTYFKEWSKSCICPPQAMRCMCGNNHAFGKIITKKPIEATKKEIHENPRSRSAKLRVFNVT